MNNLQDYGFLPSMMPEHTQDLPARITAVHKDRYELVCSRGEIFGRLKAGIYYGKGEENFPTTGDFVLIEYNPDGDSRITRTLERRTFFSRREPGPVPRDQSVCANFDYVFIIQSLNHDLNPKRLDRYLTLAWQSKATPVVVFTKADLAEDISGLLLETEHVCTGVSVHAVSARTGYHMETLSAYMQPGKTIVLLGSSGVGKSSLVNALAGEEVMCVSEIRENDSRGRHTTTHRQLIKLNNGVMIIDTPGMRELGMWDITEGLGETFSDIEQYFSRCRFRDCSHRSEPGCAVRAAIDNDTLPLSRWNNYLKLKNEAAYADRKAASVQLKQQKHRKMEQGSRQRRKQFETY